MIFHRIWKCLISEFISVQFHSSVCLLWTCPVYIICMKTVLVLVSNPIRVAPFPRIPINIIFSTLILGRNPNWWSHPKVIRTVQTQRKPKLTPMKPPWWKRLVRSCVLGHTATYINKDGGAAVTACWGSHLEPENRVVGLRYHISTHSPAVLEFKQDSVFHLNT